jgi:hypothetical protein
MKIERTAQDDTTAKDALEYIKDGLLGLHLTPAEMMVRTDAAGHVFMQVNGRKFEVQLWEIKA